MGKQIVTSIRIDEEVFREAKELGLNVSKITENALKEALRRLKGDDCPNILNSQLSDVSASEKNGVVDRRGFEPLTSAVRGRRSYH